MKTKGYDEGGFLDDGASVDPISGNEVPTGSLQEEVRDDIPAQLSEGEFVFPADVVRFIGLGQLMKIRDKAKTGLVEMEQEGQIGGSPTPPEIIMDDEDMAMDALIDGMDSEGFEEQAMNFAKGGMPDADAYTKLPNLPSAIRDVKYVNKDGEFITIATVNGDPLEPIPEGYSIYVPPEDNGVELPIENPIENLEIPTTNNQDAQDLAQNGSSYEGDVSRSEKIRKDRSSKIESLASANMSSGQMDIMYAALTPQAKRIYDTRFRDKSTRGFLDGFMADGKSPTDLLITAQKTADTQNRMAGTVEPDSGFLPNGEPIDWAKALKYVGAGLVLGPTGLIGAGVQDFTDEELEEAKINLTAVGKVLGSIGEDSPFKDNTAQPNKPINSPYTKLNQDYWKSFKGDVGAEQRRLEGLTGLNAYGHKIYKEPGSRSVWDDIAEVEANKQNTKDLQDLRATEAQDAKNLAEVRANRGIAAKKRAEATAANALANKVALASSTSTSTPTTTTSNAVDPMSGNSIGGDGNDNKTDNNINTPNATYKSAISATDKEIAEDQSDYDKMYGNTGGLASKKKPAVMKMRNDPTAGIAAKKKSKKKAQAKKGALAAKRT